MAYSFGKRSSTHLMTCDVRLQRIARRALSYGVMDFVVTEGHRSVERQQTLYADGKSRIDGIHRKGKHNNAPSQAMDLLPFPAWVNGINVWDDRQRFCVLAGLIMAAAAEEGVTIRWGGDWDSDGNNRDSSFHDLPHFELLS